MDSNYINGKLRYVSGWWCITSVKNKFYKILNDENLLNLIFV